MLLEAPRARLGLAQRQEAPIPYIVELRSDLFPSLFAVDFKGMAEVTRDMAMRFTEEQAKQIAREEKALRPGRRVFIIKVEA